MEGTPRRLTSLILLNLGEDGGGCGGGRGEKYLWGFNWLIWGLVVGVKDGWSDDAVVAGKNL